MSTSPPSVSRLLRRLSRPLTSTARVTDILVAVDRLLTDKNKQAHPHEWLAAAYAAGPVAAG